MKKLNNKNLTVIRLCVKSIAIWTLTRLLAVGVAVFGASALWEPYGYTLAQNIVSCAIGLVGAVFVCCACRMEDIAEDVLWKYNHKVRCKKDKAAGRNK